MNAEYTNPTKVVSVARAVPYPPAIMSAQERTPHWQIHKTIQPNDRKAINAYLNSGYTKYGLCVTVKDVREHRCRQSYLLLRKPENILNRKQTWRAVDAILGIALCDEQIDDFVMLRKAMVGLQQKEMNSRDKCYEGRRSSNVREGADAVKSKQPHAPHIPYTHGTARTASASTSDFAPDTASESHEDGQGEEMTGSKKKDAQKRGQAPLQSVLSAHGRQDSPKTSVNGQTSRTPLPDENEPTVPHHDGEICPLYRDELAAFIAWTQNRIRKERKRLAEDAAGKGKIDRLIFNF